MIQGIYSAVAGMANQQTMLEVITNNLANASTSAFKRDELAFSGMLNPLPEPNKAFTYNLDGVSARFATDFTQGSLQQTENPLDLALDGEGFFVIQHPDGVRYTRSGNFLLDNSGQLVTIDGFPVLGTNGTIRIQGEQIEIDNTGQLIVDGNVTAKLRLAGFLDLSGLVKDGNNNFRIANAAAEIPSTAQVKSGFLESSNVNPVHEMVKMIETMRVYESYQKTINLINETLEKANNELGKISV